MYVMWIPTEKTSFLSIFGVEQRAPNGTSTIQSQTFTQVSFGRRPPALPLKPFMAEQSSFVLLFGYLGLIPTYAMGTLPTIPILSAWRSPTPLASPYVIDG